MERIDTERLKRDHLIEEVVARYGIELRASGRSLVGRCPFHADGGRPNLYLFPATGSWYCFRCAVGGDTISFVRRIEGVGFREAVARIEGSPEHGVATRAARGAPRTRRRHGGDTAWGVEERACLAAAVEIYHNRLIGDLDALAYVRGRGLDLSTVEACRLGYSGGDELAAYLRWRGIPIGAAMRVGLLGRDGRELLAGRVVVSEIRAGQPIWLIGRSLNDEGDRPKYLGLPGRKPLLGLEEASRSREAWLVEGVFDWLILRSWGVPALALVGTHASGEMLESLSRFERLFLALDNDEAGRAGTGRLLAALGERAVERRLPEVKDVGELALRRNGRETFARITGYEKEMEEMAVAA